MIKNEKMKYKKSKKILKKEKTKKNIFILQV